MPRAETAATGVASPAAPHFAGPLVQTTYPVNFTETGLLVGTNWAVTLDGAPQASTTPSIVFSEPNGTYGFAVTGVPGYSCNNTTGLATVDGNGTNVSIGFAPLPEYLVTFVESGLPSGTHWAVTLAGTIEASTSSEIEFNETNGSYGFLLTGVPDYQSNVTTGIVTVSGGAQTIAILFSPMPTYAVTFTESGLLSGTLWAVTFDGVPQASTTPTMSFSDPNGTYGFAVTPLPGFTPRVPSGSVTIVGAAVEVEVDFVPTETYSITFEESGLVAGSGWAITLAGSIESEAGPAIAFSEPNGTYGFAVTGVPGYMPSPVSGEIVVAGGGLTVPIVFTVVTYTVTVQETGLRPGSSWTVVLDGNAVTTTASSTEFLEPNGTWAYLFVGPVGHPVSTGIPTGTIRVDGASLTTVAAFAHGATYTVGFREKGLLPGQSWCVKVGGWPACTTTSNERFLHLTPGIYAYAITPEAAVTTAVKGPSQIPLSGFLAVNSRQTIHLEFLTALKFTESGLPPGTSWRVNIGALSSTTTGSTNTVYVPAGSHSFHVLRVEGYTASPARGRVAVSGSSITLIVTFAPSHGFSPEGPEGSGPSGVGIAPTVRLSLTKAS